MFGLKVTPRKVIFLFLILYDKIFIIFSVKIFFLFSFDLITDLIIIHTDWEEFKALDFKKLNKKDNFRIYDMRNLYSVEIMKKKGLSYYSIGS